MTCFRGEETRQLFRKFEHMAEETNSIKLKKGMHPAFYLIIGGLLTTAGLAFSITGALEIFKRNTIGRRGTNNLITGGDSWILFKVYSNPYDRVFVIAELVGDDPIQSAYIKIYDRARDTTFPLELVQTLRSGQPMILEDDMKDLVLNQGIHVSIYTHLQSGNYVQEVSINGIGTVDSAMTATHTVYKNGKEILKHNKTTNYNIQDLLYNDEIGVYSLKE